MNLHPLAAIPIVLLCGACAETSIQHRAVMRASGTLNNAFETTAKISAKQPNALRIRFNPCPCDPQLVFEAHIFGQWQYVHIENLPDLTATLDDHIPVGAQFQRAFIISQKLYAAASRQKLLSLEFIPNE